jgi:hypothetical protein
MAQTEFNRIQISTTFSPDFAFRSFSGIENSYLSSDEIGKFGFTTGVSIVGNFCEYFGLETGLFFSNKGYTTNRWSEYWPEEGPAISEGRWLHSFKYIDVPIKINLYYGKGILRGIFSVGTSVSFLQNYYIKYITVGGYPYDVLYTGGDFVNEIDYSHIIGIGGLYKYSEKFSFRFIPTVRIGKNDILKKTTPENWWVSPTDRKLWSLGIEMGIIFGIY